MYNVVPFLFLFFFLVTVFRGLELRRDMQDGLSRLLVPCKISYIGFPAAIASSDGNDGNEELI